MGRICVVKVSVYVLGRSTVQIGSARFLDKTATGSLQSKNQNSELAVGLGFINLRSFFIGSFSVLKPKEIRA